MVGSNFQITNIRIILNFYFERSLGKKKASHIAAGSPTNCMKKNKWHFHLPLIPMQIYFNVFLFALKRDKSYTSVDKERYWEESKQLSKLIFKEKRSPILQWGSLNMKTNENLLTFKFIIKSISV